jgi:hypothetical protein
MKTECFACQNFKCTVLTKMLCDGGNCPFYKTEEQARIDRFRAEKSLHSRGLNVISYDIDGTTHIKAIA